MACFVMAAMFAVFVPGGSASRLLPGLGVFCSVWSVVSLRWIEQNDNQIRCVGVFVSHRRAHDSVKVVTRNSARISTVRLVQKDELPAEALLIATHIDIATLNRIARTIGESLKIPVDTSATS